MFLTFWFGGFFSRSFFGYSRGDGGRGSEGGKGRKNRLKVFTFLKIVKFEIKIKQCTIRVQYVFLCPAIFGYHNLNVYLYKNFFFAE